MIAIAAILMYLSFTAPDSFTLQDSPLVQAAQQTYPTPFLFLLDIVSIIILLAGISLIIHGIFHMGKTHKMSKKWLKKLRKTENKMIKRTLNASFSLARWSVAIIFAVVIWHALLVPGFRTFTFLYTPSYTLQPVLYLIGILGITIFIESFDTWISSIHKLFCVKVR